MAEPIILAENEDQTHRLVQLDAAHEIDREGSLSLLYTASLTQGGIEIRRISSAEPSQKFYLDCDVADAFCAAWTKFKADQEANEKAEKERKERVVAEAYAIAHRHPEISIEEGKGYWDVSIPSQGYGFRRPACYPDHLLEQVNCCLANLQVPGDDVKATA
jgi:hypothetical protein